MIPVDVQIMTDPTHMYAVVNRTEEVASAVLLKSGRWRIQHGTTVRYRRRPRSVRRMLYRFAAAARYRSGGAA